MEFFIEDLGICLSKTINRLLDISHHKTVMPVREELQHSFLDMVGILVLIDHDFVETFLILLTYLRKVFQYLNGIVANISKFKGILFAFTLSIGINKITHENLESLSQVPRLLMIFFLEFQ